MSETAVTMQAGQTLPLPFRATQEDSSGAALTTPDPNYPGATQYALSDDSFGSVGSFPASNSANFASNGKVGTVTITGTDTAADGTTTITGTLVVTIEGPTASQLLITPGTPA